MRMYLYSIENNNLSEIKEQPFTKELELHKLCESNIEKIFGLKFVKREFSFNNFRLDTLAFDESTKSFVIIEYKNTSSFSVIDQGYAYLSLMLNNKADFILEYNEACKETLKRDDVEWSQSRVLFVSPAFNNYQKEAINFKDLPFELWEVKRYSNNTVSFNPIKTAKSAESIKSITNTSEVIESVSKEIKVYTEEMHVNNGSEETLELYSRFKEFILSLDSNIYIKVRSPYIGFMLNNKDIVDILIQRRTVRLWINEKIGNICDSKGLAKDVSDVRHWGNGDYEITITNGDEFEYICSLIKQVYNKFN